MNQTNQSNQLNQSTDLLVLGVGVSPHKTDGVMRFEHFCRVFDLPYKILGEGKIWGGGDMEAGPGGGQKINELLEAIRDMDNKLLIICDTFDLVPLAGKEEILEKFAHICKPNHVLFSSEVYCWPDRYLENTYPQINSKYKFLNSGSIIGYRDDIYNLVKSGCGNSDDDQRFYVGKFLAGEKIMLDHKCELFQALNGVEEDIIIHKNRIYNKYTNSYPVFVHGNGPSKLFLNRIENHIEPQPFTNYSYTLDRGNKLINPPKVFFALYIDSTKSLDLFIKGISSIDYTNKIVHVYDSHVSDRTKNLMKMIGFIYHGGIRGYQYYDFVESDCDYYFLLEQRCILTKRDILNELLPYCEGYHRIISPLLVSKTNKHFTNYWGAISKSGYYERSEDYFDLLDLKKRGLWNSPYVSSALLIDRNIILNWNLLKENKFTGDNDMQLSFNLRRETLFMYMANFSTYGYLNE